MDDQLNDVFEVCGQPLDEVMDQYEHHHIKNIWAFLKLDLRFFVRSAVFGLGFTMFWTCIFLESVLSIWSAYFIFLVLLLVYQQYRIKEFDLDEMVKCTYMNTGRIVCYQSVALTMMQVGMLVFCMGYLLFLKSFDLLEFLEKIYVPFFFSQGIVLWSIPYIKHTFSALGLVVGMYGLILLMADNIWWMMTYAYFFGVLATMIYLLALMRVTRRAVS